MRQATSRVRFERKVASAPKAHQKSTVREKRLITDLLSAEDRLLFFGGPWLDKGAKSFFFHELRTFCKVLLQSWRKELCFLTVDKKKERLSLFFRFLKIPGTPISRNPALTVPWN